MASRTQSHCRYFESFQDWGAPVYIQPYHIGSQRRTLRNLKACGSPSNLEGAAGCFKGPGFASSEGLGKVGFRVGWVVWVQVFFQQAQK